VQQPDDSKYVPALGFRWLTPYYDTVVGVTTRERTFKQALIRQANIEPGQHVLDLACGTGTLSIWIKEAYPQTDVVGVDGDCIDCGTYLVISAEGMEKQQNVATGNKLRGIAKQFFDLATQPAIYIKMKPETFQVLIEQTLEKHGELVGYNFSNFSLLMNQYHDACEALRGAPDQHLVELRQEILAQELKKLP